MPAFPLSVTHFDQKPGLCGAAVAQMILFYKNLTGAQTMDQDALWARIQYHTAGGRPASPPAVIDLTDCPTWRTQQCEQCGGVGPFHCWCTYPPALHDTLTLDYPLPMALTKPATDEVATAAAMDSADFDVPAAALVSNGLHWIAVVGYEIGGPKPKTINGKQVSAIYIADPEVDVENHSVSMEKWFEDYVSPVNQCGAYQGFLVMIAATGPLVVPGGPAVVPPTRKPNGRPHHRPRRKPKRPRPPVPGPKRKKRSKRR
jgi:hypothetical protein